MDPDGNAQSHRDNIGATHHGPGPLQSSQKANQPSPGTRLALHVDSRTTDETIKYLSNSDEVT